MANKIICDKCGKEMGYDTAYSSTTVYPREGKDKSCRYDLCPECATKLSELITHFVERKDIKINNLPEVEFSFYADLSKDIFKTLTGSEIEETTHDTEMVSIPVEQYDSLNRMIAHYSDESERFKKCIDTISEATLNKSNYDLDIKKAIIEAKMGVTLKEAMLNICDAFSKGEENKNE